MSGFFWVLALLVVWVLVLLVGNVLLTLVIFIAGIVKGVRRRDSIRVVIISATQSAKPQRPWLRRQLSALLLGVLSWIGTNMILGNWLTDLVGVYTPHTEAFVSATASELYFADSTRRLYIIERKDVLGAGHANTFARGVSLDFAVVNKAASWGDVEIENIYVVEAEDPAPNDFTAISYPWGYIGTYSFTRIAEPVTLSPTLPLRDTFIMAVAPTSTKHINDYVYAWFEPGSFSQKAFPPDISHLQPANDSTTPGWRTVYNRRILKREDSRVGPGDERYFTGNIVLVKPDSEFNFRLVVAYKADTRLNLVTGFTLYMVRLVDGQFELLPEKETHYAQTEEIYTLIAKSDMETDPPAFVWLPSSTKVVDVTGLEQKVPLERNIKQAMLAAAKDGANHGWLMLVGEPGPDLLDAVQVLLRQELPVVEITVWGQIVLIEDLKRRPEIWEQLGIVQDIGTLPPEQLGWVLDKVSPPVPPPLQ